MSRSVSSPPFSKARPKTSPPSAASPKFITAAASWRPRSRNDPDLQQTVAELARQIEPPPPPASADGLSFEQMQNEFLKLAPPPGRPAPPPEPEPVPPAPVEIAAAETPAA